jgi:hypothetical protein
VVVIRTTVQFDHLVVGSCEFDPTNVHLKSHSKEMGKKRGRVSDTADPQSEKLLPPTQP